MNSKGSPYLQRECSLMQTLTHSLHRTPTIPSRSQSACPACKNSRRSRYASNCDTSLQEVPPSKSACCASTIVPYEKCELEFAPVQSTALETQNTLCLRTELKRISNTITHNPHNLPITDHQRHIWPLYAWNPTINKKVLKLF